MVRYFWSESNGTNRPTVRYMDFEPSTEYYNGMPLALNEAGAVMPTTGDPEYICLWDYQPDGDIRTLEIPVIEVFPDTIYEKWNEDGSIEEVRFGSGGGGVSSWNDLTDKPFGETVTKKTIGSEILETITADLGSGESTYYQLSKDVLQISDVIGKTVKYNIKGLSSGIDEENKEIVITQDMIMDMSGYGLPMFTVQDTEAGNAIFMVVSGDLSALGIPLTIGVWANDFNGIPTITEFTYNATTIKKLDPKFIDQVCGESDHVLFSAQNVEFYTNSNQKTNSGKSVVMFDIPKLPIKVGGEYVVKWDDAIYNCVAVSPMQGMVILGNSEYLTGAGDSGIPFVYVFADLSHLGAPGITVYFMDVEATEAATGNSAYHNFSISGVAPTRLPEELMPLELPYIVLRSSTPTSVMKFKITVDDSGKLTAVEV